MCDASSASLTENLKKEVRRHLSILTERVQVNGSVGLCKRLSPTRHKRIQEGQVGTQIPYGRRHAT
ncbi:MAG: hypothetical protein K2L62_02835, partial [Muribaculaceae bacterium]|nr:hypothetical protein [Muribaculaceae bacterium]